MDKKKNNSVNRRSVALLRNLCHDVTLHRDHKKEVKNTKGKLTETTGWYRIQDNKKCK